MSEISRANQHTPDFFHMEVERFELLEKFALDMRRSWIHVIDYLTAATAYN
jgi:hypothetical protein